MALAASGERHRVARRTGVAGFEPQRAGIGRARAGQQVVAGLQLVGFVCRRLGNRVVQRRCDLDDLRLFQRHRGQRRQIARRGVVIGRVQPMGIGIVCMCQTQLLRPLVHQLNERILTASDPIGNRDRRVVA